MDEVGSYSEKCLKWGGREIIEEFFQNTLE